MNKLLALILGIEWFGFNVFIFTRMPEEFTIMGKIAWLIWTALILIGMVYIVKNEKGK